MNLAQWLQLVGQLLPLVAQIVTQIEMPGHGKLKRETVVDLVTEALDILRNGEDKMTQVEFDRVARYVGIVVDDLVRMFNETGQFVHTKRIEVQHAQGI